MDAQSQSNFTLAGPAPIETIQANQPYVGPGYAELNPAYDQPANTRPVWGLAKPLPRVIRPGMMPTKKELKIQIPEVEPQKQDAAQEDLEQGRVQPTLRVDKITSQLESTRAQRENQLVQILSRTTQPPSAFSPIGRQTSSIASPLSPPSELLEEEDIGVVRPSDLEPVPEQLGRIPSRVQFAESHQGW
jgi:aquaglyceroporin related protein